MFDYHELDSQPSQVSADDGGNDIGRRDRRYPHVCSFRFLDIGSGVQAAWTNEQPIHSAASFGAGSSI